MAGIGFDLLKLWKQGTYQSLFRAYGLTTLMGSGPGVFVITSIVIVCFFTLFATPDPITARNFLAVVAYLFSTSMIISAPLQYTFFRFMADKILLKDFDKITPNFIGVLLIQLIISICFSLPVVAYFFTGYGIYLKILLVANFIILSLIWIATVLLTGIKSYRFIIWAFASGYFVMLLVHVLSQRNDINFLLFEFLLAQVILFTFLLHAILDYYPSNLLIKFDFLQKENFYYTLVFSNFCYTLGIWIDKYLFWFNDDTGYIVFSSLHLSPLYDLPVFIAAFSIIPGIAVFLLQIEAKFSFIYPKFMKAIFRRRTLAEINSVRNELIIAGREAILSLFKTQAAVVVIMFLCVSSLFLIFKIPDIYLNILLILIIAMSLNVILWGLLSILYYMTRYLHALYVSVVFVTSNFLLTLGSFYAGPQFYGYGFSLSLVLSISLALIFLNKNFNELDYTTFMMTD